MTITFNPDAAANESPATFNPMAQFEALQFDTAVPEAMRAFADTAVTQTREAYERSKATLDAGLEAMERSYDAAGQASAALNRKIIDIAQRNINSGFDLAKSLAADIQAAGGALSVEDLKPFRAHLREALAIPYRGGKVFATPELTAGPTLSRTSRVSTPTARLRTGATTSFTISRSSAGASPSWLRPAE
jgi:hypothetical protein